MTNQKKDSSRNHLLKRTHKEAKTSGTRKLEKKKKSSRKKNKNRRRTVRSLSHRKRDRTKGSAQGYKKTKENALTSPLKTIQKCGNTASGNVGHFYCQLVAGKRPGLLLS
ncbi:hypothetical protein DPMN_078839 [Dreissena polymorpha]|uniref:Uncharacterized protein n=1 Tax=Dreissena polymorpha TaxID=45954 RepID=A0A9D3YR81_DREPO|nr:hypothetical protein DPMN_078839 [Dreissena polymorpha]